MLGLDVCCNIAGPNAAVPGPGMLISLLTTNALPSGWTTSGGANGTVFNSSGILTAASSPRFTYDPVSLRAQGLIVEASATNQALFSQDFSNAAWQLLNVTKTNGVAAPDGSLTATTFTCTLAGNAFFQAIVATGTFVDSFWVKRRTGTGTISIRSPANIDTPIAVTGAWTRFSISAAAVGTAYIGGSFGTAGDAIDVAWAQQETGATPTTYIPTTSASVTRSADAPVIGGAMSAALAAGRWIAQRQNVVTGVVDRVDGAAGAFTFTAGYNYQQLAAYPPFITAAYTAAHLTPNGPF